VSAARPVVPAGPLERAPGGFVREPERAGILAGVLAGIELGEWDRRVADWLTGLDTATALRVGWWVGRGGVAGPGG
jgi:hypothetical protein